MDEDTREYALHVLRAIVDSADGALRRGDEEEEDLDRAEWERQTALTWIVILRERLDPSAEDIDNLRALANDTIRCAAEDIAFWTAWLQTIDGDGPKLVTVFRNEDRLEGER